MEKPISKLKIQHFNAQKANVVNSESFETENKLWQQHSGFKLQQSIAYPNNLNQSLNNFKIPEITD